MKTGVFDSTVCTVVYLCHDRL